jgi:hypothetical protein
LVFKGYKVDFVQWGYLAPISQPPPGTILLGIKKGPQETQLSENSRNEKGVHPISTSFSVDGEMFLQWKSEVFEEESFGKPNGGFATWCLKQDFKPPQVVALSRVDKYDFECRATQTKLKVIYT